MPSRDEKTSHTHPSINLQTGAACQKSLQFSKPWIFALSLSNRLVHSTMSDFFSPREGICRQHSIPALQNKNYSASSCEECLQSQSLSGIFGGFLVRLLQMSHLPILGSTPEKDEDGGQKGVRLPSDLT